jgi:formyl-CoA transferase
VNDYRAVAAYEQAYAAGYLRRVDHPEWGPMSIVGNPIALSETPAEPAVTAPELGQHTEEVLLEAGYTWDEVTTLRERGAI